MAAADERIVIAGAGVAGLSAAYRLQGSAHTPFVVFEQASHVGGHSRTVRYGEFRFDLGGHRFYTKKAHIRALVERLVGHDLIEVRRLSHILFNGRFVRYPLSLFSTLRGLGLAGAARAVLDYGLVKLRSPGLPAGSEDTFEQWALSRFGKYLYDAYFKVYTEKTWGVPCTELSADFAEQRIKGLSFREAVREAILRRSEGESLVRRFLYPRYGFGQIPDAMARAIVEPNCLLTSHAVTAVEHEGDHIKAVIAVRPDGSTLRQPCCEFVNSLSVDELVGMLRPEAPPNVLEAARALRYRSLVVLLLVVNVPQVSPDHWIYIPSPEIGFGRIHEPKNWSPDMAPSDKTGLVLEYFCQQDDAVWRRDAKDLAAQATRDLSDMGLVRQEQVSDSVALRLPKAYPIYRVGYRGDLDVLTEYLARFRNLYNVGRNAAFLYTSSDHYMDMGLKAAENVLGDSHDLGEVGREKGYAETSQEEHR